MAWPTPGRGLGLLTRLCAVGLFLAGKDRPLRRKASREPAGVGDQSSLIPLLSPLRPLGERSRRWSMAQQGATLSSATTLKPGLKSHLSHTVHCNQLCHTTGNTSERENCEAKLVHVPTSTNLSVTFAVLLSLHQRGTHKESESKGSRQVGACVWTILLAGTGNCNTEDIKTCETRSGPTRKLGTIYVRGTRHISPNQGTRASEEKRRPQHAWQLKVALEAPSSRTHALTSSLTEKRPKPDLGISSANSSGKLLLEVLGTKRCFGTMMMLLDQVNLNRQLHSATTSEARFTERKRAQSSLVLALCQQLNHSFIDSPSHLCPCFLSSSFS